MLLFALMAVGYLLGKLRLFSPRFSRDLTALLLQVLLPCTIFHAVTEQYEATLLRGLAVTFAASLLFYLLSLLLCRLPARLLPPAKRSLWRFSAVFPNNGFLGYPVAESVYGATGIFLAVGPNIANNLLVFTVGVRLLSHDGQQPLPWRKILLTPVNLAAAAGIVCFLTRWLPPAPLQTLIGYLADATTPLSLLLVGLSIAPLPLSTLFTDRAALSAAGLRMLALPALLLLATRLLPLPADPAVSGILLLMNALPTAAVSVPLAMQYCGDAGLAARTVFLSSLFGLATLPLLLLAG